MRYCVESLSRVLPNTCNGDSMEPAEPVRFGVADKMRMKMHIMRRVIDIVYVGN